jgi:hypothetical protein
VGDPDDPARPVNLLVERNPDTTEAQWRRWIAEAERRGFIADRPPGNEGRAGGRLTAEAIRLLEGVIK